MSSVTNFIAEVDLWAWQHAEKLAETSPNVARITLIIPIAIGTIVRDILANPAKCVEEIIRLPCGEGRIVDVLKFPGLICLYPSGTGGQSGQNLSPPVHSVHKVHFVHPSRRDKTY